MEPSRRSGERLGEARARVCAAVVRDPLLWVFAALAIIAAIQAMNGGLDRVYDMSSRRWVFSESDWPLFPSSVDGHGFLPFALTVAASVVLMGCRHSLGKSARIAFAAFTGVYAGISAIAFVVACRLELPQALSAAGWINGVWQCGADGPLWVSAPGLGYGICLLAAIASATGLFECGWNRILLLFSFAIGATATGLFYFSTPPTLVLFIVLALAHYIGCMVYLARYRDPADVLRLFVILFIAALVPVIVGICIAPLDMTMARGAFFADIADFPAILFPEGYADRRLALSEYALSFWKELPWIGGGVGSFADRLWIAGAEMVGIRSQGPLNGWLYVLAERGIVGAVQFAIPLVLLIYTYVRNIIGSIGRRGFLPLGVMGPLALLTSVAATFIDCSSLRADTIILVGAFLAVSGSSFPRASSASRRDGE